MKLIEFRAVGVQYVHLLEQAGISTVDELAVTNACELEEKLCNINKKKRLVRRTPSMLQIRAWVTRAREIV